MPPGAVPLQLATSSAANAYSGGFTTGAVNIAAPGSVTGSGWVQQIVIGVIIAIATGAILKALK